MTKLVENNEALKELRAQKLDNDFTPEE